MRDSNCISCGQMRVMSSYNNLATGQRKEVEERRGTAKPRVTNSLLYYSNQFSCSKFTVLTSAIPISFIYFLTKQGLA